MFSEHLVSAQHNVRLWYSCKGWAEESVEQKLYEGGMAY